MSLSNSVALPNPLSHVGCLDDLEANLKFMHASVSAQPDDPRSLQGLSMTYNDRFRRLGDLEDLESALKYMNAAIEILPPDTPDSAMYRYSLALIYLQRFRRLNDVDDLESAIHLMESTAPSLSQSHPNYTDRLMMLASVYAARFTRFGERKDATSGIEYLKSAIAVTPLGDDMLPGLFLNLSKLHHRLAMNHGNLAALELAIKYAEAAIAGGRPGRPEIALFFGDLASLYGNRFQWLGNLQDLQFSVRHSLTAIAATPEDYPALPNFHLAASVGFADLFERSKHEPFIRSAISHAQRSVEITPENHPGLALRKQYLAIAHLQCFHELRQPADLDEALDILQSVVDDVPENHPQRPEISYWISGCRKSRYEYIGDKHDLTLAIQFGLSSIDSLSPEDLRYAAYEQRVAQLFGDAFDVSMDIDDLNCALHYFRNTARRPTIPHVSWASAVHWTELCRKHRLPECLEACRMAAAILPDLVWMVNPITVWHEALVRLNVPSLIVSSAASSLDFHKPELAVEFLEQGLAITYKQLLQQREESTELAIQHPELAQKFTEHSFRMRQAASEHGALDASLENKHTLALEYKKFVQEIRLLPGFETFFLPPRYHTLRAVAQNGPVIILNNAARRTDAIIILAPQLPIQHIQLQASYEDLESQVQQLKAALGMCNIRSRQTPRHGQDQDEGSAQAMLQGIMAWSWDTLVSPIFQILHANGVHGGRLWWCPTGLFTQLPLHAAAPLDHNVYVQSYTPTLDVLLKATARHNAAKLQHQKDNKTMLTIVAVPELSPDHHLKYWENIPNALVEVDHIKSVVGPDRSKCSPEKTPPARLLRPP
ncbi:hypothetical protein BD779DRAFT_1668731 [Infundibulicybe gibba]|nr:hypothetical protein BD779DRAFT_1668731 [Infundibulicybe gibba]